MGLDYHNYMKEQIKNTEFWINKFYTDVKNLSKIKNELNDELVKVNNYNNNESKIMYKNSLIIIFLHIY